MLLVMQQEAQEANIGQNTMGLFDRLQHAWNAFVGIDPPSDATYRRVDYTHIGPSSYYRPDRIVLKPGSGKSLVGAIYNKIAIDCSSIIIKHVQLDDHGRYKEDKDSYLNECLTISANKDQTAKAFFRDVVLSMFDEGNVAIVPIDTDKDPDKGLPGSFDIESMRVGRINQWYPDMVEVEVYNDRTGKKVMLTLPKKQVAIIENPLYAIMNDPNSTLQRLVRKLALLDVIDEQSGSGKLDLIVQLPYVVKTEARKDIANARRQEIEQQLSGSKYGIAYIDGTEKVTQLNRSVENNLMKQVEYLTSTLNSQLGITSTIMDGTADEKTMLNYYNRTIQPIMDTIVDEMKRKFLTRTARTQGQTILYFRDPFKLVPVNNIADIADKFTRNAILSANEMRQVIGFKPVEDPKADELRNNNLNESDNQEVASTNSINEEEVKNQNG